MRNVHLRGKHKLADRWGQEVYKVLRRVNPDIPVYVVEQELGRGKRRTLHRNLLLPIPESMSTCDPPETPKKPVPRPRQCYHDKPLVDVTEDSDTDDQSSWYAVVTRPVPARRSRACLTPEEVPRILKEQEVTTLHGTLEEAEHNVSLEERRIPVEPEAVTPPTETPPIPAPRSPKTKTKSTPTGPVLGSRVRHAVRPTRRSARLAARRKGVSHAHIANQCKVTSPSWEEKTNFLLSCRDLPKEFSKAICSLVANV